MNILTDINWSYLDWLSGKLLVPFIIALSITKKAWAARLCPAGSDPWRAPNALPATPLPDAGPRSDPPWRGGRESKFLAVVTTMTTEVIDVLR
jgi:hypothetical protein